MLTLTTHTGKTLLEFDYTNKTYTLNKAVAPNPYMLAALSRIQTPPYAGYQWRKVADLPTVQGPEAAQDSYLAYAYALSYFYLHTLEKSGYTMTGTLPPVSMMEAKQSEAKSKKLAS